MRPHKALLLSTGVMLAALVAMVVLPESPLDAGCGRVVHRGEPRLPREPGRGPREVSE